MVFRLTWTEGQIKFGNLSTSVSHLKHDRTGQRNNWLSSAMTGFNKRNKHKADFEVNSVLGNMVTAHTGILFQEQKHSKRLKPTATLIALNKATNTALLTKQGTKI